MSFLEFNTQSGFSDMLSTDTIAFAILMPDRTYVHFLSGQYDTFRGGRDGLVDALRGARFIMGENADGHTVLVNVDKAQRIRIGDDSRLNAVFAYDKYSQRNETVQLTINDGMLKELRERTKFCQQAVKKPRQGEYGPLPVYP